MFSSQAKNLNFEILKYILCGFTNLLFHPELANGSGGVTKKKP